MMRKQRVNLAVYYMCGASWRSCIISDILRGALVVAIPGAIAMLVEWLRIWITDDGFKTARYILENYIKMEVAEADALISKIGLKSQIGNEILVDSGIFIDNRTFLYSFLVTIQSPIRLNTNSEQHFLI